MADDPFADAAARRRRLAGTQIGDETSASDPDWADVPPELRALHGKRVRLRGWDWDEDDIVRGDNDILVVAPALFAHARRLRQDHSDGE